MMKLKTSQLQWSGISTIVFLTMLSFGPRLLAQPEATSGPAATASDPVFLSWQKQPGVQGCGLCHYKPGGFANSDDSFSRQNELQFWLANDKHAIARRRVEPLNKEELADEATKLVSDLQLASLPSDWFGASNVLSRRICDKLGYEVSTPDGYAMFRNNCLSCHGGYSGEQDNQDFAKDGGAQPGISCNFCHQSGANIAWIDDHSKANTWRNLSPAEKTAAGMRDLVNVATQATNCYDCHIGNRDKNMFVTHVMYAAGHPPLPGIELQTFCSSMPQHWQSEAVVSKSLESVSAAARDSYFKQNFPALFATATPATLTPDATLWNTRKMLVGALAARLHSVSLHVDSADPATPDRWADYSLYDCAACHHELREPSKRQIRGYAGAPGRPRQFEWPDALLSVALDVAGPDLKTGVSDADAKLNAVYSQVPFGEPAAVRSVATELQGMLETAISRAQGKPFSAQAGREVIRRLALTPPEKLLVYDSGRQVVWAIQAIAAELESIGQPLPAELKAKITALSDPAMTGIEATLPAGRQVFIYPDNLNADLERRANYSPDRLAESLAVISKEIVVRPAPAR